MSVRRLFFAVFLLFLAVLSCVTGNANHPQALRASEKPSDSGEGIPGYFKQPTTIELTQTKSGWTIVVPADAVATSGPEPVQITVWSASDEQVQAATKSAKARPLLSARLLAKSSVRTGHRTQIKLSASPGAWIAVYLGDDYQKNGVRIGAWPADRSPLIAAKYDAGDEPQFQVIARPSKT